MKWCSVTLSDVIDRGKRLEASVFDVEAKQAFNIIKNSKYPKVNLISPDGFVEKAHYGGRLKRNYIKPNSINSIGFIGSSEMLDIYPNPVKFMLNDKKVEDLRVKENTVLISRSGTIGNVTLVNKTLSELLVSEHAIRLECFDSAGYVYTYLKTEIGKKLVCSNIYGAVIQQIEPEHLASVPIPNAPEEVKKKIHDLIIRSYELRDESNVLLDKAEQMLVEELKLPPIEEMQNADDTVETFNVKLSELNKRTDASYHVPVVKAIVKHLKEHADEVTTIGDERISKQVILPGRFKRVYVEEGYGRVFIGGKQLGELDPTNKKYLSLAQHSGRIEQQLALRENMTLITCSGTIGKVTLVGKHWENWAANQHIIRVVPASKEMAGYISVFLSSDYGYELITRYTYGSVVDEIDDNHVRDIAFPLLKDKDKQAQINALALKANEKRYQAYCLEQEALKIMDEEVIYCK
ncbi:MAG: restriction endonuclease subunit S [Clostridiales bacterium]|nr:restriction endonuclease subunit S [Clostridiales bacterium]